MAVRQSTRSRTINVRLTDYGDVPNVIVVGVRQSPPKQRHQQQRNDQGAEVNQAVKAFRMHLAV